MLFTTGTATSTRGESYKRALMQLTVGLYISEICLIGLFAIGVGTTNQSIGPLVLMIVFLAATIGWQIWLNMRLKKMGRELPSQIRAEGWMGQGTQIRQASVPDSESSPKREIDQAAPRSDGASVEKLTSDGWQPPVGRKSLAQRAKGFIHPTSAAKEDVYSVSENLSVPPRPYTQQEHDEAYRHPATTSECPIIWIPKDKYGLSKQEILACKQAVGDGLLTVTDDDAWFDEKGKIQWRHENGDEADLRKVPIWEDTPHY